MQLSNGSRSKREKKKKQMKGVDTLTNQCKGRNKKKDKRMYKRQK